MLLVGTKSDLRDHSHQYGACVSTRGREATTDIRTIVSEQRARRLAEALGVVEYLECSAKHDIDSVRNLFKVLAIASLRYTARTESDHTRALHAGESKSAWKRSLSMPVTHNSDRTTDDTIGTTWSFWTVKMA